MNIPSHTDRFKYFYNMGQKKDFKKYKLLLKLLNFELFSFKANLAKLRSTQKYYYDFKYLNSDEFHKYQYPVFSQSGKKRVLKNHFNSLGKFKEISQEENYLITKSNLFNTVPSLSKSTLLDKIIQNWENLSKIYFFERSFKRGIIKYKNRGGYIVLTWESTGKSFLPGSHSKTEFKSNNKIKNLRRSGGLSNNSVVSLTNKNRLLSNTTYSFEVLSISKRKIRCWVPFKQNLANKTFFKYALSDVVSLKKNSYSDLRNKLVLERIPFTNKNYYRKKQSQKFNSEMFSLKISKFLN